MIKTLIVIILFQYISGMATGGQASNVSYSSVSQSSDGGICAPGSGLPSSGMWRHTTARTGPRRERAIRFRDAWVNQTWSEKLTFKKTERIVPCDLNSSRLKNIKRNHLEYSAPMCSKTTIYHHQDAVERKNIVSDVTNNSTNEYRSRNT